MAANPDPQPFEEFLAEQQALRPDPISAADARILFALKRQQAAGEAAMLRRFKRLERLEKVRYNPAIHLPPPVPRYFITGKSVCTHGNLTAVMAKAKAGKTEFIAAFMAAAICAEMGIADRDTLGITATAPAGTQIVHIDTEQTPEDLEAILRKVERRAGVESTPEWISSFCLTSFTIPERRQALLDLLEDAEVRGGIHSVILDGAADLVLDVNDAAECNAYVAELHALAIRFKCPIVAVVHENPSAMSDGKMRGHLGSQLERKAESNIRLKKTDEITVVFSEKMRRAPILEKDGPRFAWSDEAGMHVSVASAATLRETEAISDLRDLAEEVFAGKRLRYADVCKGIEEARRVGEKAGEKWFSRMRKAQVIRKAELGFYELNAA